MKKLLITIMAMFAFTIGTVNAAHVDPVTGEVLGHSTSGGQYFMAGIVGLVVTDAIAKSNAQGVLPCHKKPDVKINKGGYSVMVTDCEANGFK